MEVERDGQPRRLRHQLAGDVGGAEGMLRQNAAVGDTELNHQFFFPVVCHQSNVHGYTPFLNRSFIHYHKTALL